MDSVEEAILIFQKSWWENSWLRKAKLKPLEVWLSVLLFAYFSWDLPWCITQEELEMQGLMTQFLKRSLSSDFIHLFPSSVNRSGNYSSHKVTAADGWNIKVRCVWLKFKENTSSRRKPFQLSCTGFALQFSKPNTWSLYWNMLQYLTTYVYHNIIWHCFLHFLFSQLKVWLYPQCWLFYLNMTVHFSPIFLIYDYEVKISSGFKHSKWNLPNYCNEECDVFSVVSHFELTFGKYTMKFSISLCTW